MSAILIRLINSRQSPFYLKGCRHLMNQQSPDNKATLDQLVKLEATLLKHLPGFFNSPHPFNLYTKDVTFIDNIRNIKVHGLTQYALQVAFIKMYHQVKYNYRRVELLNLVKNPQDSCIKIRWRVVTKPGLIKFFLLFMKYHALEDWRDGISTLHVDKDGKIYCHICDNIDVETRDIKAEPKGSAIKNTLINKGLNV